jgi:hypothetical protein
MTFVLRLSILALAASLTGCTTIKNLTGQNDDSVLPGSREDILPTDQQTARDPIITGEDQSQADIPAEQQSCDKKDPDCLPPVDQEGVDPESL